MRMHAQTAMIENGFVHLPKEAPSVAENLHEVTTFPIAKNEDQADSTAQALAWIKEAGREPSAMQFCRQELERRQRERGPGPIVRLKDPRGSTHVQTLSKRMILAGSDGVFEMHEVDAKPLIRAGWVKVA